MNAETHGWETWKWDESLFAGAARYYEQGRLPYAPGLADAFADRPSLDGRGRLLDVGCGPGTVAHLDTTRTAPRQSAEAIYEMLQSRGFRPGTR